MKLLNQVQARRTVRVMTVIIDVLSLKCNVTSAPIPKPLPNSPSWLLVAQLKSRLTLFRHLRCTISCHKFHFNSSQPRAQFSYYDPYLDIILNSMLSGIDLLLVLALLVLALHLPDSNVIPNLTFCLLK